MFKRKLSRVTALAIGALILFGCEKVHKPGPAGPDNPPPTPTGDYFRLMIDLRKQFVGVFNDDEFEDIVSGIKKPSEKRTQQIIGTIRRLGREMASI